MQLREEYAYTDEVWADIYNTQNGTICIVFNLYARIKWIREILQISWNILTQMKKELTEREFRAEQKIYIRGADWMLDDSYDMNKNMGILFQTNAWEGWDPEYWKRMYESVSLRQLKELADGYSQSGTGKFIICSKQNSRFLTLDMQKRDNPENSDFFRTEFSARLSLSFYPAYFWRTNPLTGFFRTRYSSSCFLSFFYWNDLFPDSLIWSVT